MTFFEFTSSGLPGRTDSNSIEPWQTRSNSSATTKRFETLWNTRNGRSRTNLIELWHQICDGLISMEQKRGGTLTRSRRDHGEEIKGMSFSEFYFVREFANSVFRGPFVLKRFSEFPISLAPCSAIASIVAQALNHLKRTIDRTRRFLKTPIRFIPSCPNFAIVAHPTLRKFSQSAHQKDFNHGLHWWPRIGEEDEGEIVEFAFLPSSVPIRVIRG